MRQTNSYLLGIQRDEQGFASLVIGLILIVVLALMTVGFAQLTRHEQSQALSKQLATQAYYAAETGINDVIKLGNAIVSTGTTCSIDSRLTHTIDSANGVTYGCVIVNSVNPSLFYQVGSGKGDSVITSVDSLSSLSVKWSSQSSGITNCQTGGFLPAGSGAGNWGSSPAVIQFSVTPLTAFDRPSLIANTYTAYLYPGNGGPSGTYTSQQGAGAASTVPVVLGSCSAGSSLATINMGGAVPANGKVLLHFISLYDDSAITISGSGNGGTTNFSGGQETIDVTGKARNVLKRLRVTVPLGPTSDVASYALQAVNICKRLETQPGSTVYVDPAIGNPVAAAGSACNFGATTPTGTPPPPGITPNTTVTPPGGTDADAQVAPGPSTVCTSGCAGGGTLKILWRDRAYNHSSNLGKTVKTCTYNWGDGKSDTYDGTSAECQSDADGGTAGYAEHTYKAPSGFPSNVALACAKPKTNYLVTLTVILTNGASKTSPPIYANEPFCYYA